MIDLSQIVKPDVEVFFGEQEQYYFDEASKFAKHEGSNQYRLQRDDCDNNWKVEWQSMYGKYGEFAAQVYFEQLGVKIIKKVSVEIRQGKDKGWEEDFSVELNNMLYNVHVKACDENSIKYYGHSYTFQYEPNGRIDPLFNRPDSICDIIVGVFVPPCVSDSKYRKKPVIKLIAPWNMVFPKLGDPITPNKKGKKRVLYLSSL